MSAFANGNPRAACVRLRGISKDKAKSSRSHIMRTGTVPNYIDQSRTQLNTYSENAPSIDQVFASAISRRETRLPKRSIKSNASILFEGIIALGAELAAWFETLSFEDQDNIFIAIIKEIAKTLGTTCSAFSVHRDETTIHAHFELVAYAKDGTALSTLLTRDVLSNIQDIAHKTLMRTIPNAERGRKKEIRLQNGADPRDVENISVKTLHTTLPADIAKAQLELQRLIDIQTHLERNKEMRSREL
ncbi:plasmid recombination protein [Loktanella salsilacus]|uniref:plasmid recombination protein n=1 Tax=Loktanella salsilacus TaxID=195913 RepID=UPI003735094C